MPKADYKGILFVGDPHLASYAPGFRKDDYPHAVLGKLAWCFEYARMHNLLPAILGDLFHRPRDNANWLVGDLLAILGRQEVIAVCGNHDCRYNQLEDDDSFSILLKAGALRLVTGEAPWTGCMAGRQVVILGTPWGKWPQKEPRFVPEAAPAGGLFDTPLVLWMLHHDVTVPGYEEQGRFKPYEIPGVEMVVNGHIHRPLEDAQVGRTLWVTPGNISRVARSDVTRDHVPAALQITIGAAGWRRERIVVPHAPFDEVFHEDLAPADQDDAPASAFIRGLAELQAHRTQGGAGLAAFLEQTLGQFEEPVAAEIRNLAREVVPDEQQ